MSPRPTTLALAGALVGGAGTLLGLMATGRLTLDTRWGRSLHQLGPVTWTIDAPRDLVWQQMTSQYTGRIPRDMRDSLEIDERSDDMLIARHYSDLGGYTTETTEVINIDEPNTVRFRHLRGPVPHAVEEFRFEAVDDKTTRLTYEGELGIDGWALGRLAATAAVVPIWMDTVVSHVEEALANVDERMAARRRREARAARNVSNCKPVTRPGASSGSLGRWSPSTGPIYIVLG